MANKACFGLFSLLNPYKTVLLTGLGKGAGKTSVMVRLVEARFLAYQESDSGKPLALTSIGQGSALPEVPVYPGMFAATAVGLLPKCDFTRKIIHLTGMGTALGEVAVVQALSGGRVQLAGPAINSQLDSLVGYLLNECGAGQVLVDGSGGRKTFLGTGKDSAVVLCVGLTGGAGMDSVIRGAAHASRMITLPSFNTDNTDSGFMEFSGALTDDALKNIMESIGPCPDGVNLVIDDAGKSFITDDVYQTYVSRGLRLFVKKPSVLAAVAVNPGAADPERFLAAVREAVDAPVFDVVSDVMSY